MRGSHVMDRADDNLLLSEMFGSYFHCQTGVFAKYEQHYKY